MKIVGRRLSDCPVAAGVDEPLHVSAPALVDEIPPSIGTKRTSPTNVTTS
jgi:hypothetical protein